MEMMVQSQCWYLNSRMPFPVFSADSYGVDVLASYSVVANFSLPKIRQMLSTAQKTLITGDARYNRFFQCFSPFI